MGSRKSEWRSGFFELPHPQGQTPGKCSLLNYTTLIKQAFVTGFLKVRIALYWCPQVGRANRTVRGCPQRICFPTYLQTTTTTQKHPSRIGMWHLKN